MPEQQYEDAARRIADSMTLHSVAGNKGKWASFRLSDGREVNPHTAYDRRVEAVKHARWDRDTTLYLEIPPDGMTSKEADACLRYARFLHSQGWRLPDPEFDYDASTPTFKWDQLSQMRNLVTGGH